MRKTLATCGLFLGLSVATTVHASMCEANFEQRGSYPGRRHYVSHVDIAGTTLPIAFAQLKTIFAETGVRFLSEDRGVGQMIAEMPARTLVPAQPITVRYAETEGVGQIELVWTVKEEMIMSRNSMRRDVCSVLSRLTDARGRLPVEQPKLAFGLAVSEQAVDKPVAPVIAIEASELTRQVNLSRDNPARISALFIGKRYRVSGMVRRVSETYDGYEVQFDGITIPSGTQPNDEGTRMLVVCRVPKASVQSAASVYPDQRGTLTGRFERVENHSLLPQVRLGDCGN